MNKQELIKKIELQTFVCPDEPPVGFGPTVAYKKGFNSCAEVVINLIEQLDEPQKVKVPELPSKIAKYLEWAKEEQFDFTEDYNMISWEHLRTFGGDDTEYLQMWFFDNDQKENERRHILFLQAYTDGYEIEKEPQWVVRNNKVSNEHFDLYFKSAVGIDNEGNLGSSWSALDGCLKFPEKEKAEAVATLVDGSVEEV